MLVRHRRLPLVLTTLLLAAIASGESDAAAPSPPRLGLGYEYDLGSGKEEFLLPDPIQDSSIAPDHPLYLHLRAPWVLIEKQPGIYDWSEIDRIVDPYRAANYVIVLCLYGTNPGIDPTSSVPSPVHPRTLKAWLELERAAATHFKGRVRYHEVWDEPNRVAEWTGDKMADFAYLLKNSSVTIRSVDPEAMIVQGGLPLDPATLQGDLAWQEALYRAGIATYVDVRPIHPAQGAPLATAIAT